jgi:TetR/AcrR family transcriptional regulator, cholesterol catabolism regulator
MSTPTVDRQPDRGADRQTTRRADGQTSRRRQIEDVASALFCARGYAATSVRDIAKALDLQGGSLYAHVSSKEDVLWAIVDDAAGRFLAVAGPIASGPGGAVERLRELVNAHVAVVTESPERARVFLEQWTALSTERRQAVLGARDQYEACFRQVVADGVAAGDLTADPWVAAVFTLSALNGIPRWYRPDGPLTPDQIAERFADLAVAALAGAPANHLGPPPAPLHLAPGGPR